MSIPSPADPLDDGLPTATVDSRRLARRLLERPLAVACLVYLAIVIGIATFAPLVMPEVVHEQAGDLLRVSEGPSADHFLGTDGLGRDVLNRLLVGARPTMIGVAEALVVGIGIAVPIGLAAGYFGGWFDRIIGWLTDLQFALPGIAIILVVLSVFRQSMLAAMVTLGVLAAPAMARIIRSATLPVRQELYIAAAQVSGLSRPYILARHIMPRIAGPVIVLASLFAAGALLAQGGLAFLGLIVPLPAPSWGGMISEGLQVIILHPWLIWPSGIAMTLTVVAFGLLGDIIRDANAETWSPRVHRRRPLRRFSVAVPPDVAAADALLRVAGLTVTFPFGVGSTTVVEGVSFDLRAGETLGLMGESGCGKTVTAMSLLRLLPGGGEIASGQIIFDGRDLTALSEKELRRVRGKEIGLISQEPMASLNPVFRVGWQLALAVRRNRGLSRGAANKHVIDLLRRVHLPEPELVARRYPHELSGGMAQRVAIARALAGEPKLLIADEPTTALDVTVQAEILDLLRELQQQHELAILLVTHDCGVIADLCDRVVVMYAGQIVERAAIGPIFRNPLHPYTEALLASNPHYAEKGVQLPAIAGTVPKPGAWPSGCHFHPRCSYASVACVDQRIPLKRPEPGRETRCIHYDQLLATRSAPAIREP